MKAFVTALFICISPLCFAQLSGWLTNTKGLPVVLANVTLLRAGDTAVIKNTVTDSTGVFVFSSQVPGRYTLRFSSIGYQTQQTPVIEVSSSGKNTGVFVLTEETNQLSNVIVRAEKPLYQQQAAGIVVNVENSIMTKGSTVLEVLQRSPGVVIDRYNNTIALNGKQGVVVLMNGKPSRMSMDQLLIMLNGMNADDIATIELLNTPPAKYDAEGSAGVINIVLKKDKKKGTNGSVTTTAGYGYGEKASASARVSRNGKKVDLYASANYSHERGYSYLFAGGTENVPVLGGPIAFEYNGLYKPLNNGNGARAGIDARLTPKLTVGASVDYWHGENNSVAHNTGKYVIRPDSILTFDGTIRNHGVYNNIVYSAYAERNFKEGEKLSINGDYLYYNIGSPTDVQSVFTDGQGNKPTSNNDSLLSPQHKGYGKTIIQVGVLKIDYTRKLSKSIALETGIKGTYTNSNSTSGIETLVNGHWVSSGETANSIVMKEGIGAAYASLNAQLSPSVNVVAGARYEYYNTHADDSRTGATAFKRKLGQLFPSLFVTKKLNKSSSLQFSYTKRITRPSYNDLASYVAYNDPLSVISGNPQLKPTITNNIKLGYNYKNYIFSVLLSRDDNPIAWGQVTQNPSSNVIYISPQNLDYFESVNLQVSIPVKIASWWNMNYNINGGWRQNKISYALQPSVKAFYAFSSSFTQTFRLPKSISVELSGRYNSAAYYASDRSLSSGGLDLGVKKEFSNNKGSLQLAVGDVLQTQRYRAYRGYFTKEAYDTKVYIDWHGESTKVPIFKLTWYYTFGNSQQKTAHQSNVDDEKGRVR